jgi:hypothetical protein
VCLETSSAHWAQVDFAEFRFPWGNRYALLVVLCYSRLLWIRFYPTQDMRTLFSGLEEAQAAGKLAQRMKVLTQPAVLVVEEIGYVPVSRTGAMLCFR